MKVITSNMLHPETIKVIPFLFRGTLFCTEQRGISGGERRAIAAAIACLISLEGSEVLSDWPLVSSFPEAPSSISMESSDSDLSLSAEPRRHPRLPE